MKTTIDIPDSLLREAKIVAAREQITLRAVVTRALEEEFTRLGYRDTPQPAWRKSFGTLRDLRGSLARVDTAVAETFEKVDKEDWK